MLNNALISLFFTLLMTCTPAAQALDCGRASTATENTVCDNADLAWLDRVFTDAFRELVIEHPLQVDKIAKDWVHTRDACISKACLRGAYLNGIGKLYNADRPFDWQGVWWNTSAANGNGGKIIISNASTWQFNMDATIWGGVNNAVLSGKVDIYGGVGFTNNLIWGGECAVILLPRTDGNLEVSSDSHGRCNMLTSGEMVIDGLYVKAPADPRPPATLLSLGIFPDKALDDRFRQLVGNDYQQYVTTATSFVYSRDLDNLGATVLTLWVKGMAFRKSAMIMYTPDGKIWALRTEPGKNKELNLHYVTTEKDKKTLPKTLANWRLKFTD